MDMQNYTTPFANTGDREEFSIDTDPSGKVSLEKGWTELYQLRPEEGGLFILRKIFNQMMKLVSTDTVTWKTQTFPNWIDDKGDGLPFAYPKNALVKYTDGNTYVSKIDDNTAIPTDANNWVNFKDFGSLNINALNDKPTPVDTDNLAIQEVGGLLKKLSFANLKIWILSLFSPTITGTATLNGTTNNTITLTDIVSTLGLEAGDVIRIQYSGYNKLHTVESITNNNLIVVNYEHSGNRGNGSLKLPDATESVTVTRVAKCYNAPLGLGQDWVNVKNFRTYDTYNTNSTGRTISVSASLSGTLTLPRAAMVIDGKIISYIGIGIGSGSHVLSVCAQVPKGSQYKINNNGSGGTTIENYWELR